MPEWMYKHTDKGGDWTKAFGAKKTDVIRTFESLRKRSIKQGMDLAKKTLVLSPDDIQGKIDEIMPPSFHTRIVWVHYLTFKTGWGFTSPKQLDTQSIRLGCYRFVSTLESDCHMDELVEKFRDALAALSATHSISRIALDEGRRNVYVTMLPSNMFESNIDVGTMERLPLVLKQVEKPRNVVELSKLGDALYFDLMSYLEDEHMYWQYAHFCSSLGYMERVSDVIMFGELKDASLQAKIDEVTEKCRQTRATHS